MTPNVKYFQLWRRKHLYLCPVLFAGATAMAQNSPFQTGASALQSNLLTLLTPVAVILVIGLGLPGTVIRHFWDRFGAALLISVVDGAIQTAVAAESRGSNGTTVQLDPESGRDVLTEVLRSTVGVPPTVVKRNGDRIQIVVARDVDFSSVYVLQQR